VKKGKKSKKTGKKSRKGDPEKQLEAADEMVDSIKTDMLDNLKLQIERLEKELAGWRTKKC
jgi:hypothetical protein